MRGRLVIGVLACAAAGLAMLPLSGPAAASRCGTAILKDWADGHIDHTYPVRCYQDALARMPDDMRSYTSAPDDINRALLARLRNAKLHRLAPKRLAEQANPRKKAAGRSAPVREALSSNALHSSRATAIPLPLLVLAAVGLLLVASGAAGVVTRRLRGHGA